MKNHIILVKAFYPCKKQRFFTFVQDDKVNNVILSEAKNLFSKKVPNVFNDFRDFNDYLIFLFYQNLLSINDVDTLDGLCNLSAVEVINTFHLSALTCVDRWFRFHLFNACYLTFLYRE